MSCKELAALWTKDTNREWTQPLGFDYAAFEIAADVLKRAGSLKKKKIREALVQTNLKTMVGPIKFNKKNYALTPLVGRGTFRLHTTNSIPIYPQRGR